MPQSKEEKAAYRKDYYAKNKEREAENCKRYRSNNREAIRKMSANWVKNNPEKRAASTRKYTQSNPEQKSINAHRRRAKKYENGVFRITKKFMRNLYNSPCVSCGASERIQADHTIPIIKGGRHSEGNLQPLCVWCNTSKGSKLHIEFVAKKG